MPLLGLSLEGRVGCATAGARILKLMIFGTLVYCVFLLLKPVTSCGPGDGTSIWTKALMKDLRVALRNFQVEYNRWPEILLRANEEAPIPIPGALLITLMASPHSHVTSENPRKIRFVDLPFDRKGLGGLIMENGVPAQLVDPWGMPYWIMADVDEDGIIANPEAAAPENMRFDKEAPSELPVPVIIFSAGPDKDPNTWNDNITSWRH